MPALNMVDWIAFAWFVGAWCGFAWLVDKSPWRHRSLTAGVDKHRHRWMNVMMQRDLRMIDTSIIAGLQNGTAFFASTSLLAIGASFALLNATDTVLAILDKLPFAFDTRRGVWETKVLGLMVIYAYAFFKFGWAYRLINYTSILIGSASLSDRCSAEESRQAAENAATMNALAGAHFNRGLRALFLSIGFLGWFANGWIFLIATGFIIAVLYRRQFHSKSRRAAHSGF